MNPLVSVIVTTFERPDFLKRAINSVQAQTYNNIEIIIVDDASKIDLSSYINNLTETSKFPVTYLKNSKNSGACFSRNEGIRIAKGAFITGLDDDDEFTPERIDFLVHNYNPNYSFIATNAKVITKKSNGLAYKQTKLVTLDDMLWENVIGTQVLVEKERIQGVNAFDISLTSAQDADMWIRLIHKYGPAYRTIEPHYVLHTEHDSARISNNKIGGLKAFLTKHKDLMHSGHIKYREFKINIYSKQGLWKSIKQLNYPSIIYLLKRLFSNI